MRKYVVHWSQVTTAVGSQSVTTTDGYGQPAFNAPVRLKVHFNAKTTLTLDGGGTDLLPVTEIFSYTPIVAGDYVFFGSITDEQLAAISSPKNLAECRWVRADGVLASLDNARIVYYSSIGAGNTNPALL